MDFVFFDARSAFEDVVLGFEVVLSDGLVIFDVVLVFLEGFVSFAGSSSFRFRFLGFEEDGLTVSLPSHDCSVFSAGSMGTAFVSSSSSFGISFPRKASAFLFLFDSLSPAMVDERGKISAPIALFSN